MLIKLSESSDILVSPTYYCKSHVASFNSEIMFYFRKEFHSQNEIIFFKNKLRCSWKNLSGICGLPIVNHYSELKMAFIKLTNSGLDRRPHYLSDPPNPSIRIRFVLRFLEFQTRYQSFVIRSFGNQKWIFFYLRLAALCLLFWGARLRCPSIGICQMTLATEYSCHARAPWFVWGFLLRYDKASIRLYVHICTWGGNRPTSCRIFWHIIWICANLELPFPAGHLSGPNALHDKRKHCFPIPVHLVPSHLTSHLIQLLQLPCPRWLTGFRAPSDWLLWMPPMARHLSSLVCRARRCHKLGQSQLSSTERNLWCFGFSIQIW